MILAQFCILLLWFYKSVKLSALHRVHQPLSVQKDQTHKVNWHLQEQSCAQIYQQQNC